MIPSTTSDKGEGTLLRPFLRRINEGSHRWILLKIRMDTNSDMGTTKIELLTIISISNSIIHLFNLASRVKSNQKFYKNEEYHRS